MVKQQCLFGTFSKKRESSRQTFFILLEERRIRMTNMEKPSNEQEERIIEIEIERLRPFKEHPFQVKDDKEM